MPLLVTTLLTLPTVALPTGAPQPVCRVDDDRLREISGMVATSSGYILVNDGADDPAARRIFYLSKKCKVTKTVAYPSRPRDTEDMALAADGTLWVGDIGDNGKNRETIAVWRLAPGAKSPKLFRLTYPDGPHDAEAMIALPDGTPVVITKDAGRAGLYRPDGKLSATRSTPMRHVGDFDVPGTTTANPYSFVGRLVVTGAATSADGRRVVIRTYADAFEFDVPDGDPIRAITSDTPREIPLPDEPQGESVAYSPDGESLLTISESQEGAPSDLLAYPLPASDSASPSPSAGVAAASPTAGKAAPQATTATSTTGVPAGALVAGGVLLAAAALLGTAVSRRRRSGSSPREGQ
ncbi:hypothetical protein [Actinoplanes sp. NBRC 101535]|uniref:hypothetical protein n=1 Tax=Actinoplanes sp. NBRC 101535 TaxID=3032196 RepID=UPI002553B9E6|nr:hypothetical protein [Actinoplanes sp. NBRC 101535]